MATGQAWRPRAVTRALLLVAMGLQATVFGVTVVALLRGAQGLPGWFVVLAVVGAVGVEWTLASYAAACWRGELKEPVPADAIATATLAAVVVAFVCTSSLHHFYPFRPSLMERLEGVPLGLLPPRPMLRLNYAATAATLVTAAALAVAYGAGARRAALVGMAVLAVLLLVPNDNCDNDFNQPWIRTLGASPLMFAPASVGLVVAVCGLCGLWRRTSLLVVLGVCGGTLLVGVGHITRVIW